MNIGHRHTSLQQSNELILQFDWARMAEPIEWIVNSLDTFTKRMSAEWDFTGWLSPLGPWEGKSREHKEVEVRYLNDIDPQHSRAEGHAFTLTGRTEHLTLTVHLAASLLFVPDDLPRAGARIVLRTTRGESPVSARVGDAALTAGVVAWEPLEASLVTSSLIDASHTFNRQTSRRAPGWGISIGHRLWLADEAGPVKKTARGITATPLAGGTLLSASDRWSAHRVVKAMHTTLEANGLHQLPHTPGRYEGPPPDWKQEQEVFDYHSQITGLLPDPQGRIAKWMQHHPDTGGYVPFGSKVLRGEDEVFLEPKHGYRFLYHNYDNTSKAWANHLVAQAERQQEALPRGATLEWHVSTPEGAAAIYTLLDEAFDELRINVIYTPEIPE